jgi:hypothetical protein
MRRPIFLTAVIIAVSGCVFGKRSEVKEPLDRLNGENYQSEDSGMRLTTPVPIIINNNYQRPTILRGEVRVGKGIEQFPGKLALVEVLSDGKKVAEVNADSGGLFNIETVLKNGHYVLRATFKDRKGEIPITISKYLNTGLVLEIP